MRMFFRYGMKYLLEDVCIQLTGKLAKLQQSFEFASDYYKSNGNAALISVIILNVAQI